MAAAQSHEMPRRRQASNFVPRSYQQVHRMDRSAVRRYCLASWRLERRGKQAFYLQEDTKCRIDGHRDLRSRFNSDVLVHQQTLQKNTARLGAHWEIGLMVLQTTVS
jgi:hypothetical protein